MPRKFCEHNKQIPHKCGESSGIYPQTHKRSSHTAFERANLFDKYNYKPKNNLGLLLVQLNLYIRQRDIFIDKHFTQETDLLRSVHTLIRWLIITVFSTLALSANAQELPVTYELSLRSLQLGNLTFSHELKENQYNIDLHFETTGLAGALFDAKIDAQSTGTGIEDRAYEPRSASFAIQQRDENTSHEMTFDKGVLTSFTSNPRLHSKLDPAKQAGAVDPITALGYILRPVAIDRLCKLNVRIFDGVTATRITLSQPSKRPDGRMQCQGNFAREHGFTAEQLDLEGENFFFTALYRVDRESDDMIIDRIVGESTYGQFQLLRN